MVLRGCSIRLVSMVGSPSRLFPLAQDCSRCVDLLRGGRTARQMGDPNEVVGGHCQLRPALVAPQPDEAELPPTAHGLPPAEALLHPFAHPLALPVAPVARRSAVNRALPSLRRWILRHVRRDAARSAARDEGPGVITPIPRHRLPPAARQSAQHLERHLPPGRTQSPPNLTLPRRP